MVAEDSTNGHHDPPPPYSETAPPESSSAQASLVAYFASRPLRNPSSTRQTIIHHIRVDADTVPDQLLYPGSWGQRDVTEQDWATFLNYLLPHHTLGAKGTAGDTNKQQDTRSEASNPPESDDVIRQWNYHFFAPRAINVVLRYQPEPAIRLSPAVEDDGASSLSHTRRSPARSARRGGGHWARASASRPSRDRPDANAETEPIDGNEDGEENPDDIWDGSLLGGGILNDVSLNDSNLEGDALNFDDLNSTLDDLRSGVLNFDDLNSTLDDLRSGVLNFDDLNSTLDDLRDDVLNFDDLNSTLEDLKGDVLNLQGDLSKFRRQFDPRI